MGLRTQFGELQKGEAQGYTLGKATKTGNVGGSRNRGRAAGPHV